VKLVVDASVALKWFFADRDAESDTASATAILDRFAAGEIALVAPCHFQAEVCAVLTREAPAAMLRHLARLIDLSIPVVDDAPTIARAMRLSNELGHHLFDTLYHAVALEEDATLVTADRRYLTKAGGRGNIADLATWESR